MSKWRHLWQLLLCCRQAPTINTAVSNTSEGIKAVVSSRNGN
jgi:hypothetical protein